jgi:quercetin dioxygenase-like cupin family protein
MAGPVFQQSGEGTVVRHPLAGDAVFKVRGAETAGTMTVFETIVPPGNGPPLHVHANEEETLYVLEREARFQLGDESSVGSVGALAFVPRGTPHAFQNVGEGPLRMLIHFAPSGMERFFEAFAAIEEPGPDAFAEAAAPAGMSVVGPPLGGSG